MKNLRGKDQELTIPLRATVFSKVLINIYLNIQINKKERVDRQMSKTLKQ